MILLLVMIIVMLSIIILFDDETNEKFCDFYAEPHFMMRMYDGPYLFNGVMETPFGEKYRYAPPYIF